MYGDKDIFRIKDLIHSLDENHWKNKQWAADIFKRIYSHHSGRILVVGGWYGLMAYQLRQKLGKDFHIISSDLDPKCEKIGHQLFGEDYNIEFKTWDMNHVNNENVDAIVCTSVEHVDADIIKTLIERKQEKTWVVLQSNNFHDIPSHINTHKSLKDFEEWCESLFEVEYSGEMNNGDWSRYMIIGRGNPLPEEYKVF